MGAFSHRGQRHRNWAAGGAQEPPQSCRLACLQEESLLWSLSSPRERQQFEEAPRTAGTPQVGFRPAGSGTKGPAQRDLELLCRLAWEEPAEGQATWCAATTGNTGIVSRDTGVHTDQGQGPRGLAELTPAA